MYAGRCTGRCIRVLVVEDAQARYALYPSSRVRRLADTVKGAMLMQNVWTFIFPGFGRTCITVFGDVWGARYLPLNPACRSKLKHNNVRHRLYREMVFCGGGFHYPCRVRGATCRFLDQSTQQCGPMLQPRFFVMKYLMHFRNGGGGWSLVSEWNLLLYLSKLRGQNCFYLTMDNGFQAFDVVPADKLLCIWFAV